MIGTFERNVGGIFIYKVDKAYLFLHCQTNEYLFDMPRSFNIWQSLGQLKIWLAARGVRTLRAGEKWS